MIKVKYLAIIADVVGLQEELVDIGDKLTVEDLVNLLKRRHPRLQLIEKQIPVLVLVNGELVDMRYKISSGDEVALTPPMSGG